jgi:hypothetical protein
MPALAIFSQADLRLIADEAEPRIQDLRLAEELGFGKPANIRNLIERHTTELETYGIIFESKTIPSGAGRPGIEYWLSESQALLICMRSDAPNAQAVRREVILIYQAWRRGHLAPIQWGTQTELLLENVRGVVREEVAPLRIAVERVEGDVIFVKTDVAKLRDRVDNLVPRHKFPRESIKRYCHVVIKRHHCLCPNCHEIRIINEQGNLIENMFATEHWYGRERTAEDEGWITCKGCNEKLRNSTYRQGQRVRFESFQADLRELFPSKGTKPKKGTPRTIPARFQLGLFD